MRPVNTTDNWLQCQLEMSIYLCSVFFPCLRDSSVGWAWIYLTLSGMFTDGGVEEQQAGNGTYRMRSVNREASKEVLTGLVWRGSL